MKPERLSKRILGITNSKAKMYEYHVPEEYHIAVPHDPAILFTLTIGMLGEYASQISNIEADQDSSVLSDLKKQLISIISHQAPILLLLKVLEYSNWLKIKQATQYHVNSQSQTSIYLSKKSLRKFQLRAEMRKLSERSANQEISNRPVF